MNFDHTIIELPSFADSRGSIFILEKILPFSIQRIFWICGVKGATRGGHRHINTRQALICVSGKVTVFMENKYSNLNVVLDNPSRCLLVEPQHWHTMTFDSDDSILLVAASTIYNHADYIYERYCHD